MALMLKESASPSQVVKVHPRNITSPRSEEGSRKSVPQKVFMDVEVTCRGSNKLRAPGQEGNFLWSIH